jgi:hypothetical protein
MHGILHGDAISARPLERESLLVHARTLRDVPRVRKYQEALSEMGQTQVWFQRLRNTMRPHFEKAVADLAEVVDATDGALHLEAEGMTSPGLSSLAQLTPLRDVAGFDPSRPSMKGGSDASVAGAHVFVQTYSLVSLSIFGSEQDEGYWFVRLPFVAGGENAATPQSLIDLVFDAQGPLPLFLEQTVEAADATAAAGSRIFVEIVSRYMQAIANDIDLSSEEAWQ